MKIEFQYNVPVDNQVYNDPCLMLSIVATHLFDFSNGAPVLKVEVAGYKASTSAGMIEGNGLDLLINSLVKDWQLLVMEVRRMATDKYNSIIVADELIERIVV